MADHSKMAGEMFSELVDIRRVTKVVKGGRTFSFTVLVVVGNKKGFIGMGMGKAKEVVDATNKAVSEAKKSIIRIPLRDGRAVHHDVMGCFSTGQAIIRYAPPGTGVIAGGAMRPVFVLLGIQDVVAKFIGPSNPYVMIMATFDALQKLQTARSVAAKRGKKIKELFLSTEDRSIAKDSENLDNTEIAEPNETENVQS